ncbi:LuxR family transcriptional regulator [Sphingomonas sp. AP4-R1]|uniref:helix-turn-helix transcriptional regulator n=1 Tax=Sphingomonas sp. AP4-R1 TaxID=2735134 RepID=UPI0014939EEE|nr:autoinducer binding domain-containing protein [Sphingomonas sp. AP4-R1]QJU59268.1 LuxR family transcriptional regulator [Sphingomonas sp. AP4-R1]
MIYLAKLERLLAAFRDAVTEHALYEALLAATSELGFSQFAMGHHVDLSRPAADAIRLTSYDADWIEHVVERGYFVDDPIHLASTRMPHGFMWSDVKDIVELTARHKQILAEALGFGLVSGFTIPVHIPGEYHGTCTFAASSDDRPSDTALWAAQLCGTFAFDAARRIMRLRGNSENMPVPGLTPRQMDALVLVGRGKNDGEIAELLGVSRSTAHEHVEGVRRAYGNAQRPHLIARALFDGQVSFTDLLRR